MKFGIFEQQVHHLEEGKIHKRGGEVDAINFHRTAN
jgi:hypothetical protein